jgi:hypothetical protein
MYLKHVKPDLILIKCPFKLLNDKKRIRVIYINDDKIKNDISLTNKLEFLLNRTGSLKLVLIVNKNTIPEDFVLYVKVFGDPNNNYDENAVFNNPEVDANAPVVSIHSQKIIYM